MALEQEVLKFIYDSFPLAKKNAISPKDSLLESGIIDSLGVMEIVNFLIDEKNMEIDEDDLIPDNFESVVSIVKFIETKMGK